VHVYSYLQKACHRSCALRRKMHHLVQDLTPSVINLRRSSFNVSSCATCRVRLTFSRSIRTVSLHCSLQHARPRGQAAKKGPLPFPPRLSVYVLLQLEFIDMRLLNYWSFLLLCVSLRAVALAVVEELLPELELSPTANVYLRGEIGHTRLIERWQTWRAPDFAAVVEVATAEDVARTVRHPHTPCTFASQSKIGG
jgi:hypothetical protein